MLFAQHRLAQPEFSSIHLFCLLIFALSALGRLLMLVSVDGCPLPSTVSLSLSTEITAVARRVGGSSVCPALD
jgi:hypothetical protein